MRAIDVTGNVSEYSVGFAYNYKPSNILEEQSLVLTYKNKKKNLIFTWQYKGQNPIKGYVLYFRTDAANEFKALTDVQQKNSFQTAAITKASGIYEVRMYFKDGTFLRSNQLTLTIKE